MKTKETRNNGTIKEATEYYVGLTDTEFKERYRNHKKSFTLARYKHETDLGNYIWSLKKKKNIRYSITWKILGRAPAYNNVTKMCKLCTLEKYFIICKPTMATLNQKCGILSSCQHARKFSLASHKS